MDSNAYIPVVRDFGDILLKKGTAHPRIVIETLLLEPKCFADVKQYFVGGGVCGHKVMDVKGAVDAIKRADKDGHLKSFKLNDFQIGNALKSALRTRYDLDKRWKILGENSKRVIAGPAEM